MPDCPDAACAFCRPNQPATSHTWARRQALDAARQAVTDAKNRRTALARPADATTPGQGDER